MSEPSAPPRLPVGKRLVFWLVLALSALVLVEIGTRALGAAFFGWRVLGHGTRWRFGSVTMPDMSGNVAVHGQTLGSYTKYFPYERKWVIDSRGSYTIRINNHGLRGPDFTDAKPPGVTRLLTLGASSTFGFEDRDDETYPYFLERALAHRVRDGRRFEVINFAIPHASSRQIVAMFLAEGIALSPDVVTIYEGINDAKYAVEDLARGGWLGDLARVSLAAELARELRPSVGSIPTAAWDDDVVATASRRYVASLEAIEGACAAHGVRLLVVTQQARSLMIEREALRGVSFREEDRIVRAELARSAERRLGGLAFVGDDVATRRAWFGGAVQALTAAAFLVHGGVMDSVRAWASERHVELVDGVAALDRHRDSLVSWVHLDARGNKLLAKALAERVLAGPPRRP